MFYRVAIAILSFIIVAIFTAPLYLPLLSPGFKASIGSTDEKTLTKFCLGITVPRDNLGFLNKKQVVFNDSSQSQVFCLGLEIYYGE